MNGILFKPWKIVYIAEHPDIEIQTRRVIQIKNTVKTEDCTTNFNYQIAQAPDKSLTAFWTFRLAWEVAGIKRSDFTTIRCPYQQRETVYIKEAWLLAMHSDCYRVGYKDGAIREIDYSNQAEYYGNRDKSWQWINPMFMPEWAARYFITITDVRAERLQEITSWDCEREGCPFKITRSDEAKEIYDSEIALEWFRTLWNSINKDYPFEANPWVWVYTFRREK